MNYDRNAVIDRLLKWSEVRNHGLESVGTMMLAQRLEKLLLMDAPFSKPRRDIPQQLEPRVVHGSRVLEGIDDVRRSESAPVR